MRQANCASADDLAIARIDRPRPHRTEPWTPLGTLAVIPDRIEDGSVIALP